jgi:hypothetical protein
LKLAMLNKFHCIAVDDNNDEDNYNGCEEEVDFRASYSFVRSSLVMGLSYPAFCSFKFSLSMPTIWLYSKGVLLKNGSHAHEDGI